MYEAVYVYDEAGSFLGYAIKEDWSPKLQSASLYADDEQDKLHEQLGRLNDSLVVKSHWPDANDPAVQALVNDSSFEPIEYKDEEVIDEDKSYLVYQQIDEVDDLGDPTGRKVDGPIIDLKASVIHTKIERVPARPSDYFARVKKAQEAVARSRMT